MYVKEIYKVNDTSMMHRESNSPTSSFPLKTYNRHCFDGFRASGGSLYFKTTPLYVFVSVASKPLRPKLGLSFSISSGSGWGSSAFAPVNGGFEPHSYGFLWRGDFDRELRSRSRRRCERSSSRDPNLLWRLRLLSSSYLVDLSGDLERLLMVV